MKHTPGPWTCDTSAKADAEEFSVYGREDGRYLVAEVLNANGFDQNEANARLIAAAPSACYQADRSRSPAVALSTSRAADRSC